MWRVFIIHVLYRALTGASLRRGCMRTRHIFFCAERMWWGYAERVGKMRKYYLCFFDILGQREVLKGVCRESFSLSRKTDFRCQMMRKMSEKMLASLKDVISNETACHGGRSGSAGAFQFSDSFCIYVEDVPEDHAGCVAIFKKVLVEVGYWYWEMLGKKMPIRGFVAHGDADIVERGNVIGPVFERFEEYEKKADYVRIVFTPNTTRFVGDGFGDLIDEMGALNVLSKDVVERVKASTLKLGFSSIHENLLDMSNLQEILRKDYKTVCALMTSGFLRISKSDTGGPYIDAEMLTEWPPYPRLHPEDYLVAYLKVDRDNSYKGTSGFDEANVRAVNKVFSHFTGISKTFSDCAAKVFREHLNENRFAMDEKTFVNEARDVDLRVQHIDREILVSIKNESKISVFALAFALGELSLLVPELIDEGVFVRGMVVNGSGWLVNNGLYGPVVHEAYEGMNGCSRGLIAISGGAKEEFRANEIVCRYACHGPNDYLAMQGEGNGFVNFKARILASNMDRTRLNALDVLSSEQKRDAGVGIDPHMFSYHFVRELSQFAERLRNIECMGECK